ncbi:MAG: hypothetical protein WBC06_12610 [Chitinophagaceae bacterium]
MKHTLTTVFAILSFVTVCFTQTTEKPKHNALSFELGKTGLIYNLKYDHKVAGKNFGFGIGVGSNFAQHLNLITAGGSGYYLLGRQNRFFELGIDLQYLVVEETSDDQRGIADIFVYPDYSIKTLYPSLNIGYRQYGKSGLFRFGFSPGIIKSELIPGGYIGYGFTF